MTKDKGRPDLPSSGYIVGRAATEADVAAGNAAFVSKSDEAVIAKLPIKIPQHANFYDEDRAIPVVIIQAELANDEVTLGARKQDGTTFASPLAAFELLGQPANAESPGRGVLWACTIAMLLFTWMMYLFFAQRGWGAIDIGFEIVAGAICMGLLVTLIDADRFWWGMRLISFVIFMSYFAYLIHEFWFSSKSLDVTRGPPSAASPYNAVLGFLFYGLPSLLYTFWGSTLGKLGHIGVAKVSRWDIATIYIAWGAKWLFLLMSVAMLVAMFFR